MDERLPISAVHDTGGMLAVPVQRLDALWEEMGSPAVALVKVDVEGTELSVLEGGRRLLEEARPWVLVETEHLAAVVQLLRAFDYTSLQPHGFFPANFIFVPR